MKFVVAEVWFGSNVFFVASTNCGVCVVPEESQSTLLSSLVRLAPVPPAASRFAVQSEIYSEYTIINV